MGDYGAHRDDSSSAAAVASRSSRSEAVGGVNSSHNSSGILHSSMDSGVTPRICGSNPNPYGPTPTAATPASGYGTGRDGLQFDPDTGGTHKAGGIPELAPSLSEASSTPSSPDSVAGKIHEDAEAAFAAAAAASSTTPSMFKGVAPNLLPAGSSDTEGDGSHAALSSRPSESETSAEGTSPPSKLPLGATPLHGTEGDLEGESPDTQGRVFGTSLVANLLFGTQQQQSQRQGDAASTLSSGSARDREMVLMEGSDDDLITPAGGAQGHRRRQSAAEMNGVGSASFDRRGERFPRAWSSNKKVGPDEAAGGAAAAAAEAAAANAAGAASLGVTAQKFNFDSLGCSSDQSVSSAASASASASSQQETPMKSNQQGARRWRAGAGAAHRSASTGTTGSSNGRAAAEAFHSEEWGRDMPYDWDPVRDNPEGRVKEGGVISTPNGGRRGRSRVRRSDSGRSRGTTGECSALTSQSHGASTQGASTKDGDDEAGPDGGRDGALSPGDGAFPVSPSDTYNGSPTEYVSDSFRSARSRGSAGGAATDGESTYKTCQGTVLHPLDWSNKGSDTEMDEASHGVSTISDTASGDAGGDLHRRTIRAANGERRIFWSRGQLGSPLPDHRGNAEPRNDVGENGEGPSPRQGYDSASPRGSPHLELLSPETGYAAELRSSPCFTNGQTTHTSGGHSVRSGASGTTTSSRQLINDLVWLEKKIADNKAHRSGSDISGGPPSRSIADCDALSFGSDLLSPSSDSADESLAGGSAAADRAAGGEAAVLQSIVCRDVYAPPGKLQIVITSTKDGPSVHTVKKGSTLEGHLHPGDLIVAVDDVDARTYSAEQVMKMLTSRADFERKITVLHFEDRS